MRSRLAASLGHTRLLAHEFRPLPIVVAACVLTPAPLFLLGAMSHAVSRDIPLSASGLGLISLAMLGTSAVLSIPAGSLLDKLGDTAGLRVALGVAGLGMVLVGCVASTFTGLVLIFALLGVAGAFVHPAANMRIAATVPLRRRGAALGIKHAALPAAAGLAGWLTPLAGTGLNWRTIYIVFGFIALVLVFVPRKLRIPVPEQFSGLPTENRRVLTLLAVGFMLSIAAVYPVPIFLVAAGVSGGMDLGYAGTLLGVCGLISVLSRLSAGGAADRLTSTSLLIATTSAILLSGAGLVILAGSLQFSAWGSEVLICASLLVSIVGWAWTPLLFARIFRRYRQSLGGVSGFMNVGVFVGTASGPPLFGLVVQHYSYSAAFLLLALLSALGAALILASGLPEIILRCRSAVDQGAGPASS